MNRPHPKPAHAERPGSGPTCRAAAALAALLLCLIRPAAAQDRDLIGRLPESAQVVVVVHNAAAIVADLDASPAAPVLRAAGVFNRTLAAWKSLAERLGWTPQETADRLLGGTCVLVLTEPTEQAGWCLLATISGDTDQRLRERLEIAPADVVQGQPVLALRNGEFLLAVQQDQSRRPGRRRLLLLGPNPRLGAGLFRDVLPALAQDCPAPIRATAVFEHVRAGDEFPVAVYGNLAAPGSRPWAEHLALSIAWRPGALTCDVVARLPDAPAFAALPRTDLRRFSAAANDAPLAIAACLPVRSIRGSGLAWGSPAIDPEPRPGAFERWVLLLHAADRPATDAEPPPHRATLLVESSEPLSSDTVAHRFGRLLEGPQTTLGVATEGLPPAAVRRTSFDTLHSAIARRIFGPDGSMVWTGPPTSPDADGGGGPGFNVVCAAPLEPRADADLGNARDLARAIDTPSLDADRWVAVGRLDPRLLLALAPGPWPEGSPTRAMLQRVTRLAWEFRALDDGLLRGCVRADLAPAAEPPRAP